MKTIRWMGVKGKIPGMVRIGPILQMRKGEPLTMQTAYDTDCETGVRWMNEEKSKELSQKFPTICAMAELIEKERDKYKREANRLKKLMSRIASKTRPDSEK